MAIVSGGEMPLVLQKNQLQLREFLITDLKRNGLGADEIACASDVLTMQLVVSGRRLEGTDDDTHAALVASAVRKMAVERLFRGGAPENVVINVTNLEEAKNTPFYEKAVEVVGYTAVSITAVAIFAAFPWTLPFTLGVGTAYKAIKWFSE